MSVLVLVIRLCLLGVAAAQSIVGMKAGSAIALATSGTVTIAVALYRSPVVRIRKSAGEVQRSSVILMSYMLGLSVVSKSLSGQGTVNESNTLPRSPVKVAILLSEKSRLTADGAPEGGEAVSGNR
jgi:hypothetical protein